MEIGFSTWIGNLLFDFLGVPTNYIFVGSSGIVYMTIISRPRHAGKDVPAWVAYSQPSDLLCKQNFCDVWAKSEAGSKVVGSFKGLDFMLYS